MATIEIPKLLGDFDANNAEQSIEEMRNRVKTEVNKGNVFRLANRSLAVPNANDYIYRMSEGPLKKKLKKMMEETRKLIKENRDRDHTDRT